MISFYVSTLDFLVFLIFLYLFLSHSLCVFPVWVFYFCFSRWHIFLQTQGHAYGHEFLSLSLFLSFDAYLPVVDIMTFNASKSMCSLSLASTHTNTRSLARFLCWGLSYCMSLSVVPGTLPLSQSFFSLCRSLSLYLSFLLAIFLPFPSCSSWYLLPCPAASLSCSLFHNLSLSFTHADPFMKSVYLSHLWRESFLLHLLFLSSLALNLSRRASYPLESFLLHLLFLSSLALNLSRRASYPLRLYTRIRKMCTHVYFFV